MIDELTIQKIKDATSIVEVIEDFYTLRKKGVNLECLCPFHADRHMGSFVVSPRKNTFTCYSCGEHGDAIAFLMKHEGLKYIEAVRWLGRKYGMMIEDPADARWKKLKPAKPHKPLPKLPTLELPSSYVEAKSDTSNNVLANWLRQLPWSPSQRARVEAMLKNYCVGTSKQGHTIWWQIDEKGKVRTGKLMLYKPDGHRDKETQNNFGWIHSRLIRAGKVDEEKVEMRQCLFGLHLLDFAKPTSVNICESEKTALICAIAYGGMKERLWMASGGKTQITAEKLQPLIQRGVRIFLYPDHDGFDEWSELAKAVNYPKLSVATKVIETYWTPEDGDKADIADIIIRLLGEGKLQQKEQPPPEVSRMSDAERLEDIMKRHPIIKELIDTFDLELITR